MKKDIAKLKKANVIEYVVKHGQWRLKRGKKLSAILPLPFGILNPQLAFQKAKEILKVNLLRKQSSSFKRM